MPGAALLGIHLEGPFINPQRSGAFTPESIVPPSYMLFDQYLQLARGQIRLVALAPEMPGAEAIIRRANISGAVVSAGHSDATWEQMMTAAEWGVRHITHTYNAMRPLNHREPGILGAALTDDRFYHRSDCGWNPCASGGGAPAGESQRLRKKSASSPIRWGRRACRMGVMCLKSRKWW